MTEIEIKLWDKDKKINFGISDKNLQKGDDFLILLDKFLIKSKIKRIELRGLKVVSFGKNLGLTSRRIIETAVSVLNTAIKSKNARHFL